MRTMVKILRQSLMVLVALTLITGIIYPLAVTGIARGVFPNKANGSLVVQNDTAVGSALIGQPFSDPKYFWSRPSATSPVPYNAAASSGSNLGPTNPALLEAVQARIAALRAADPGNDPGPRRSGHCFRQRPRSANQSRRGLLPGRPGGKSAGLVRRGRTRPRCRARPR
jgi:hypothetical protein